jgi:thioredoxin 1
MASNAIVEVTDANFDADVLKSETPVLVDFWATWCGPCRAIAPIVEELAGEYQGKVKVGKMDVDRNGATPMRYKVTGIPTLLVFKNGQVVEQLVGYRSKEDIQKAHDKHVGAPVGTRTVYYFVKDKAPGPSVRALCCSALPPSSTKRFWDVAFRVCGDQTDSY